MLSTTRSLGGRSSSAVAHLRCRPCCRSLPFSARELSGTASRRADEDAPKGKPPPPSGLASLFPSNQSRAKSKNQYPMPDFANIFAKSTTPTSATSPANPTSSSPSSLTDDLDIDAYDNSPANLDSYRSPAQALPHHLHIYSTKHNTHITLTRPNRDPIISLSAGNIGFRKAGRGNYDAAYQLGAYVMTRIKDQGLLRDIQKLEVVLRGFGPGREAVTKALLGSEGRFLRGRITQVTDSTRLKFGGTRGKKPRRLG